MSVYGTDVDDMIAADTLSDAEATVMRVALRHKPSTLDELRASLENARVRVDRQILNLAILQLLNTDRLTLTADRQLHISD